MIVNESTKVEVDLIDKSDRTGYYNKIINIQKLIIKNAIVRSPSTYPPSIMTVGNIAKP